MEVGSELAVEPQPAVVVPGHGGQVVGELVPGVQMRPLARVDLAELAVPVLQVPLEVPLSPRVAPLPVVPAAHIGRRLREVELPDRGLDVRPLLARCWLRPHRQGLGLVAEQPQHRILGVRGLEELVEPRTVQGAAVPLLGRHPDRRGMSSLVAPAGPRRPPLPARAARRLVPARSSAGGWPRQDARWRPRTGTPSRRSSRSADRAPAASHPAGRGYPGAPGRTAAPPQQCLQRRRPVCVPFSLTALPRRSAARCSMFPMGLTTAYWQRPSATADRSATGDDEHHGHAHRRPRRRSGRASRGTASPRCASGRPRCRRR